MWDHISYIWLYIYICISPYKLCTLYYQSRLNLVSEIGLVNILTFSAWDVTVSLHRKSPYMIISQSEMGSNVTCNYVM